jgi:DNA modification methylase
MNLFIKKLKVGEVRQRWYKYKESFSPSIVEKAITECNIGANDLIIDPFNGAGTTTLSAAINNIPSIGIEINPFAVFLADTKNSSPQLSAFKKLKDSVLAGSSKGCISPLLNFSTFSEKNNKNKWLFNSSILNSFEGGWKKTLNTSGSAKKLLRLALIGAALDNCNATRDGKCLKYKFNWQDFKYNKSDFLHSLEQRISVIEEDIGSKIIDRPSKIIHGDSRETLKSIKDKFSLCITSPPYLNSFDYTDLYRPELFLGRFVKNNSDLRNLRERTLRSHVEIKLKPPKLNDFGFLYSEAIFEIKKQEKNLWDKQIPIMIQAYFEDIHNILKSLLKRASRNANLWMVVSNSAYAGVEVPVDLIIGEIAGKVGWYLKEIEVLQYLNKRISRHSPEITTLRESIIKLSSSNDK